MKNYCKKLNHLEIIKISDQEILVNKGFVYNMWSPNNNLSITNAEQEAWNDSGDIISVSENSRYIYVKITKEATPTTHGTSLERLYTRNTYEEYPPGSGITVTTTEYAYFRNGQLFSAVVEVGADLPSYGDSTIVVLIGEWVDNEVIQHVDSDIWAINPLFWIVREISESDSDDGSSDSDSDDSDSDSDSDSDNTGSDGSDVSDS